MCQYLKKEPCLNHARLMRLVQETSLGGENGKVVPLETIKPPNASKITMQQADNWCISQSTSHCWKKLKKGNNWMRGGRSVTETAEFLVRTQGHEIYSIWLSVKEQVSGAWPIWYMEVMPDFKNKQRGLTNLSSPLSTQHTMMSLRLKTFHIPIILETYIKYTENNLSAWQTHWKFKGWTKWGTDLKSRSHTCINHKGSFHHKLEIAAYGENQWSSMSESSR